MTPKHTIFALTLIRPWCWAIVHGFKNIENRVWTPDERVIGQRMAIHSGQKYDADGADQIDSILDPNDARRIAPVDDAWPGGRLVGSVCVLGYARHDGNRKLTGWDGVTRERAIEALGSPWVSSQPGVAWILSDAIATEPVEGVRGMQKLWLVGQDEYELFVRADRVKRPQLAGGKC